MSDQSYKTEDKNHKTSLITRVVPRPSETKAKSFDMLANVSEKHKQILKALETQPDLTRAELALVCDLRLSSICGRVNELLKKKLIKPSGTKEDKSSGRMVECLSLVNCD